MPDKNNVLKGRPAVQQPARREFIARIAVTGAAVAAASLPHELFAQAAEAPKPPADPAGTVPNSAVLAEKNPALKPHSERPLTGSVTAENHNFAVTPNDRMFIRNNLLTPDLDAGKHRLTVKGLVEREVTFSLDELKSSFPVVSMQGMLECAGSGRASYVPNASGTPWSPTGGMGCPK